MRRGKADKRGNTEDRRRRKQWMLKHFGDGITCRCTHCGKTLRARTLEADRKKPGGSYRRENIQPSCGLCNRARGNDASWLGPLHRTREETTDGSVSSEAYQF